jgi:hypothetical protein
MDDSNQVGKRYRCEQCGLEVICVRAGAGRFSCHGAPMPLLATRPLPSSD